jgi:hypothetical protein
MLLDSHLPINVIFNPKHAVAKAQQDSLIASLNEYRRTNKFAGLFNAPETFTADCGYIKEILLLSNRNRYNLTIIFRLNSYVYLFFLIDPFFCCCLFNNSADLVNEKYDGWNNQAQIEELRQAAMTKLCRGNQTKANLLKEFLVYFERFRKTHLLATPFVLFEFKNSINSMELLLYVNKLDFFEYYIYKILNQENQSFVNRMNNLNITR